MASNKRKPDSDAENSESLKRPRICNKYFIGIDPTFGQRYAIPGLDGDDTYDSDGGNDGLDPEALKYLQAVRSEAARIPTLLIAPIPPGDQSIYNNGIGDARGYYEDGAYSAMPTPASGCAPTLDDESVDSNARQAYFNYILAKYAILRSRLQENPPRFAVERLSKDHSSYMSATAKDWKAWSWRLHNTDAVPAQLASMSKSTILRLLRLMAKDFGKRTAPQGVLRCSLRTSQWVWGLLARLPARGELNSEEIGVVRDLGKRAVWVSIGLRGVHDLAALEEDADTNENEDEIENSVLEVEVKDGRFDADDDGNGHTEAMTGPFKLSDDLPEVQFTMDARTNPTFSKEAKYDGECLEEAKTRLLANLEPQDTASQAEEVEQDLQQQINAKLAAKVNNEALTEEDGLHNIRATIDMIITIAGEMYGQRDLLEFRQEWD